MVRIGLLALLVSVSVGCKSLSRAIAGKVDAAELARIELVSPPKTYCANDPFTPAIRVFDNDGDVVKPEHLAGALVFSTSHGKIGGNGAFVPEALAHLEEPVTLSVEIKGKPTTKTSITVEPDYGCKEAFKMTGLPGENGGNGGNGGDGYQSGMSGGSGGEAANGTPGEDTPPIEIHLYALAGKKTPKLAVAVMRWQGETAAWYRVFDPTRTKLSFVGEGGRGGDGGKGGNGGAGAGANGCNIAAGAGGPGGLGGDGAYGGDGPELFISYDQAEGALLSKAVVAESRGGIGGRPGAGGRGGRGGSGSSCDGRSMPSGYHGHDGYAGSTGGDPGRAGPAPVYEPLPSDQIARILDPKEAHDGEAVKGGGKRPAKDGFLCLPDCYRKEYPTPADCQAKATGGVRCENNDPIALAYNTASWRLVQARSSHSTAAWEDCANAARSAAATARGLEVYKKESPKAFDAKATYLLRVRGKKTGKELLAFAAAIDASATELAQVCGAPADLGITRDEQLAVLTGKDVEKPKHLEVPDDFAPPAVCAPSCYPVIKKKDPGCDGVKLECEAANNVIPTALNVARYRLDEAKKAKDGGEPELCREAARRGTAAMVDLQKTVAEEDAKQGKLSGVKFKLKVPAKAISPEELYALMPTMEAEGRELFTACGGKELKFTDAESGEYQLLLPQEAPAVPAK